MSPRPYMQTYIDTLGNPSPEEWAQLIAKMRSTPTRPPAGLKWDKNGTNARVLELVLGLNGERVHTYRETANVFNVTPERIRQRCAQALRWLTYYKKFGRTRDDPEVKEIKRTEVKEIKIPEDVLNSFLLDVICGRYYEDSRWTAIRILNVLSNHLDKDVEQITVGDVVKWQHKLIDACGVGKISWNFLCKVLRDHKIELTAKRKKKAEWTERFFEKWEE